jgi:phosphoribosylformylglycinamidine synthase II
MKTQTAAPPLHRQLGLTEDEYARIEEVLGRPPNHTELAMYSVMWSEHCSYKSSRIHLASLPSKGPHVLMGPGEGAGVVEIDGVAVALRIESHNHPSFVEPVQGAATGIGGIVRDLLSVGARPIALLDSLRFGPLPAEGRVAAATAEKNRYLVEGVVSGISSYSNCIGVPTVGGEIKFEDRYSGNPLVNVMCIGVAPVGGIRRARAEGPGNAVILLGSSTGRDGIGGVSILASATFEKGDEDKRPSVQVGDPFGEKLLIEACLELMEGGLVVGIQDLGGAGLACAASETAARAGTGMRINLEKVRRREDGMEPFEVLISESQERMLVVVRPEDAGRALGICEKWGLWASVIGEVTETGRLEVFEEGELVADVPAASLGDGPTYDRPRKRPVWIESLLAEKVDHPPTDLKEAVVRLVGSLNIASKRWVWQQYDHQVMLGTVVRPGHDAALLRVKGARHRLAVTTDGNGRWCFLDPYLGSQHAVAEAARNLSVLGATPIAVTNCLNFGNPERPELMWQFAEAVRGLGDACRALGTPVVGGNVSFYNETEGQGIDPTPVVGMIGLLAEEVIPPRVGFEEEGDVVMLVGTTKPELGGSEYVRTMLGRVAGQLPSLDFDREAAVGRVIRKAVAARLVRSAHDCSEGGLAVALAECCIQGAIGATVAPEPKLEPYVWLFSETPSRMLISIAPQSLAAFEAIAEGERVPISHLGMVGGTELSVEGAVSIPVRDLAEVWENSFSFAMGYAENPDAAE